MSGDEIWVAKGTYYTSSTGDQSSSFVLNNGVKIYGNFYGNETNINQRIDLIPNALGSNRTNETILSGDINLLNDSTDNANHVMYIVGNTLPVIIDGVKITGGNAMLTTGQGKGGGIYIQNAGNVILNYVIVSNNTGTAGTEGKGGGIYVESAAMFSMQNSTVVRNRLIDASGFTSYNYFGGGIYINCPQNQIANSFIENNKIISNRSNIDGGGLYIDSCLNLNISNTSIKSNNISSTITSSSKYLRGGGLACNGIANSVSNISASEISQNTITVARGYTYGAGSYFFMDTLKVSACFINENQTNNNTSTVVVSNQGGGMYSSIAKMTNISNSTFDQNKIYGRYASGGGLYLVSSSTDTATVQNCRFSGNELNSLNYFAGTVAGGGLYSGLKVKLLNCLLSKNTVNIFSTTTSTSDANTFAYGGGLFASNYTELIDCSVDSNNLQAEANFADENCYYFPDIIARAYGGGIYSVSKLNTSHSTMNHNTAKTMINSDNCYSTTIEGYCYGGGIYNEFTTAGQKSLISNCAVNNNKAETYISLAIGGTRGGGIYGRNIDILNNEISNNATYVDLSANGAINQGGGIFHEGTGKLYHNIISHNTASADISYISGGYTSYAYGGGLYSNSTDSISNCLIHNNSVRARNLAIGGGIYNKGSSKISNLTVAENHSYNPLDTVNSKGSGVFTRNSGAQMLNSIFYFNDLRNYYDSTTTSLVKNCVIQQYQSGNTNWNINPQFTDTAANDFHVLPASIAINRGDSAYIPPHVLYDLDGFDRISGNNVDIGTYELNLCVSNIVTYDTICYGDPYFFNGQNLTISGIYKDTLTNMAGCDSLVTLHFTVNFPDALTDVISACDSYTWINGITYTASNNTATHTLINTAGCDSVVTLNLTINHSKASTDVITACHSYTWIDGITYTSSNNTAKDTLTTMAGCDSVVTLNLTINIVDISVTINGITLTANATGATYQWTDCNNNYMPLPNGTNQSYTPASNGSYAVIVTKNYCTDTSICQQILTVGKDDMDTENTLILSPNPNNGQFTLELNSPALVEITDAFGRSVYIKSHDQGKEEIILGNIANGVYFVKVTSNNRQRVYRMVVKK